MLEHVILSPRKRLSSLQLITLLVFLSSASSVSAETDYWKQSAFFVEKKENFCGRYNPLNAVNIEDFKKCFYIGAGWFPTTHIEPEDLPSGWSVSDNSDAGYNIFIGWHFKPHWFGELSYADLGEADVSNPSATDIETQTISQKVPGLHLGYWFFEPENRFNLYGKLGVSAILNEATTSIVPYEKQESVVLSGGIGTQWRSQSTGLFARLAADFFDGNNYALGLNVGYYFGGTERKKKVIKLKVKAKPSQALKHISRPEIKTKSIAVVTPAPITITPITTTPVAVVLNTDSDADNIIDADDDCLSSRPGVLVDDQGCEIVNISLKGVKFKTSSANLTNHSKDILDAAADTLISIPAVNVEIQAHTCSLGSEEVNQTLSDQRAMSVRDYLVAKGVDASRLQANGYGESNPIASNGSKAGRHKNRRVELKVIGNENY